MILKRAVIAYLFCFLSICIAHGSTHDWKWIGPAVGSIRQIVPDRNNAGLWFAVSEGKIYRTTNGARDWRQLKISKDSSEAFVAVHSLTSEVWAITIQASDESYGPPRLWYSKDHGITFQSIGTVPFREIRLHPSDPKVLFGIQSYNFDYPTYDLSVSHDAGGTWVKIKSFPFPLNKPYAEDNNCYVDFYSIKDVVVSPFHPETFYATGRVLLSCGPRGDDDEQDLLLQSDDEGISWKILDHQSYVFVRDGAFPNRIYSYSNSQDSKLTRLTPKGWIPVVDFNGFYSLKLVPNQPDHFLAVKIEGYSGRLVKSEDGGKSWQRIPTGFAVYTFESTGDSLQGIFASSAGGLFYKNLRQSWTALNKGFQEGSYDSIFYSSQTNQVVAQAEQLIGFIYRSNDQGKSWVQIALPYRVLKNGHQERFAVNIDPENPDHWTACSEKSTRVSRDGGRTWKRVDPEKTFCSTVATKNPQIKYAFRGVKLFKSTDGGSNFVEIAKLYDYITGIVPDPNDHKTLNLLGSWGGLYKSIDGGKTFQASSTFCESCRFLINALVPLDVQGGYLALAGSELFRTTNHGKSWSKVRNIYPADKLFVADSTGKHLYLVGEVFLESTDGGQKWRDLTPEFKYPFIRVLDMTDPRITPIYLATDHGIYVGIPK
jgi:photosystem II stability/assembly factor-like uncharacterized protein